MAFNLLVRLQFRHVYGLFVEGVSNLYVSSGVGVLGAKDADWITQ